MKLPITHDTGRPMLICGNTFAMLARSRLAVHFTLAGDSSVNHCLFDCVSVATGASAGAGACC